MGRMQSSERGTARVTVRVPAEKKEQFRDAVEDAGGTMTESITDHIDAVIARHDPAQGEPRWMPDDDELADAYRALDRAVPPDRTLPVEVAESVLADELDTPKPAIRSGILDELRAHDPQLIRALYGSIRVRARDTLPE